MSEMATHAGPFHVSNPSALLQVQLGVIFWVVFGKKCSKFPFTELGLVKERSFSDILLEKGGEEGGGPERTNKKRFIMWCCKLPAKGMALLTV
jgi:hypothetical protein